MVAFGSRARWTAKEYSDLDLAVLDDEPLPIDAAAALAEGFGESDLPFKVDVVVWADINDHLRDIIRRDAVDVQTPEAGPASAPGAPSCADRLHLSATHRRVLDVLLREHLPDVEVWACGSRVNERSHTGSDLELVLRGPGLEEIPAERLAHFTNAVRESTIPFLVEVRDWARLPQSCHREIERDHAALRTPTSRLLSGKSCWPRVQLGAVMELLTGFPFKSEQYTDDHHAPRLLRGDNVAQGTLRWSGAKRLAASATTVDAGYWLQEGDVVLAMDRPWIEAGLKYASVRRTDLPALLVQRVARLRGGERLHTRFLHYLLGSRGFTQYVTSVQTGTAVPHISARQIKDFAFCLPSLSEQRAIAHILGTLDDRIELNRRMNETLEAVARTLFKSWFVDFEPVRAKMAGGHLPFPRMVSDLFPDRLVESSVGMVPSGWHISEIGKEVTAVGGATPSTKEAAFWTPGEHAWATPKDLSALTAPVLLDTAKKVTSTGLATISSGLLPWGTVLMSSRAPIGYLAIAEMPVAVNQGFIAMVCQQRLPNLYVLFWCRENLPYIRNIAGGSTFAEISKKSFRPIPVLVPPPNALDSFSRLVGPLYDRIVGNVRHTTRLIGVRNLLLPSLISGEIPVPQAEKVLEKSL